MLNEKLDYAYYDSLHSGPHRRRCIDGSITGCSKCVGYCQYSEHSGFLSEKLCKEHKCIEKGCNHFLPKQQQPYKKKMKDSKPEEIETIATAILSRVEGLKATHAYKNPNGWKLNYVTITNCYSIREFEKRISEAVGETVIMNKIDCDFETAARIIFA